MASQPACLRSQGSCASGGEWRRKRYARTVSHVVAAFARAQSQRPCAIEALGIFGACQAMCSLSSPPVGAAFKRAIGNPIRLPGREHFNIVDQGFTRALKKYLQLVRARVRRV